jgi:DNA-binding NarL/FixJ family response regulator
MSINVTLIEDHQEYRNGLSFMINNSPGFKCTGAYDSIEDALRHNFTANLILLDIALPGKSGIEGILELRQRYPETQIVMLTGMDDDYNILRAIMAGANGYLLKKTAPVQLLNAIKDAINGGMPMTPSIAYKVVEIFKKYVPSNDNSSTLTNREKEILSFLVEGFNYKEISKQLFISLDTVRNHIRHIYEKLQVHSKSQAVAKALKEGLI